MTSRLQLGGLMVQWSSSYQLQPFSGVYMFALCMHGLFSVLGSQVSTCGSKACMLGSLASKCH